MASKEELVTQIEVLTGKQFMYLSRITKKEILAIRDLAERVRELEDKTRWEQTRRTSCRT